MSTSTTTLTLIALVICLISFTRTNGVQFKSSLIHRHSPSSPFYNPNLTARGRVQESVRRSLSRQRYLSDFKSVGASPDSFKAPVKEGLGEYLMRYYIGTPAVETFGIVDTASDLIWLQCLPCLNCYNQTIPFFDSTKSETYEKVPCNETDFPKYCQYAPGSKCQKDKDICQYIAEYEDETYSEGDLSTETLLFIDADTGKNYTLLNMAFGCGHNNTDVSEGENPPGLVGLNREPLSLVKQIEFMGFSYCFVPQDMNLESPIFFGIKSSFEGGRTPMMPGDIYYYLRLEGISVGNQSIPIPPGTFNVTKEGDGGFIIDSGQSFTTLPSEVFKNLVEEVKKQADLSPAEDRTDTFDLCVETSMNYILSIAPEITFHFAGVDLTLKPSNTWIDNGDELVCLAILPSLKGLSILGSYQQQNINVGYHIFDGFVSFQPRDCTKV